MHLLEWSDEGVLVSLEVSSLGLRLISLVVSVMWPPNAESSSTGCNRRNGPNFGRVFLMLNYTEKTQNTCIQSWTVWEIIAIENWKLLTSFESTNDSLECYLIRSREHRTTEARVKCISLHFLWRSYSTSCGVSVFGRQQTLHVSSDVTR